MVSYLLFACSPALHSQDKLCLVVMYLFSILYILLNGFASGFFLFVCFLEMLVSVFIRNIGQSFLLYCLYLVLVSGKVSLKTSIWEVFLSRFLVQFVYSSCCFFLQCLVKLISVAMWSWTPLCGKAFIYTFGFIGFSVGLFRLCISLLAFSFFSLFGSFSSLYLSKYSSL